MSLQVASHHAKIRAMPSQHADPQLNVRPPAAVTNEAKAILEARGREIRSFVVACLSALNADPDTFLELLDEHWPAAKPRGRPRQPSSAEPDDQRGGAAPRSG